jgi:hypothetical protein
MRRQAAWTLALALALVATPSWGAPVDEEVGARIEALRKITPGQPAEVVKGYNAQMDAAWNYFDANRAAALPVIRRKLAAELDSALPSQMVLLDIGYYLVARGDPTDVSLATKALLRVDPAAAIVSENQQQLFYLSHRVAANVEDDRLADFLHRAFLARKVEAFVPQHAMTLDATLTCVFVYGLQGKRGEAQLRRALSDPAVRLRALEALVWVGSSESVDAVVQAMSPPSGHEAFIRGVAFMMMTAGPRGREALLAMNADKLDPESRKYFDQVSPDIRATTYAQIRQAVQGIPGDRNLSPAVVRERLVEMVREGRQDRRTSPGAILDANVPAKEVVSALEKFRQAALRRVSDEALSEVKLANAIINAVQYREAAGK